MSGTVNKVWRSKALTPLGVSDTLMEPILMASRDKYGVVNGRKNERRGERKNQVITSFIHFFAYILVVLLQWIKKDIASRRQITNSLISLHLPIMLTN